MLDTVKNRANGLDLEALGEVVEAINQDAGQALVGFDVTTRWTGQTRSETTVDGFTMLKVTLPGPYEERQAARDIVDQLMGKDPAKRFNFIQERASAVEDDAIDA